MAKYIDLDLALSFPFANGEYDHKNANEHFIYGCESYREWLEGLPTADVAPIVHAHWEYEDLVKRLNVYSAEHEKHGGITAEAADAIEELYKAARAMHEWIFLNSGDEQAAYDECGLSDNMNAALGYGGQFVARMDERSEDK